MKTTTGRQVDDGVYHPCYHNCDNKTFQGYCKTTACINPKYNQPKIDITSLTFYQATEDDNIFSNIDVKNPPNNSIKFSSDKDEKQEGGIYMALVPPPIDISVIDKSENKAELVKNIIESNNSGLPKRTLNDNK